MGRDPAAWFSVNSRTAEITLKKIIDRESSYIVNGMYKAELLAITRGKKIDLPFVILYLFIELSWP